MQHAALKIPFTWKFFFYFFFDKKVYVYCEGKQLMKPPCQSLSVCHFILLCTIFFLQTIFLKKWIFFSSFTLLKEISNHKYSLASETGFSNCQDFQCPEMFVSYPAEWKKDRQGKEHEEQLSITLCIPSIPVSLQDVPLQKPGNGCRGVREQEIGPQHFS